MQRRRTDGGGGLQFRLRSLFVATGVVALLVVFVQTYRDHRYDRLTKSRDAALQNWRAVNANLVRGEGATAVEEKVARDEYFALRDAVEAARGGEENGD